MRCTACNHEIRYKGGENTKDHGCWNMECPARVEARYYGNVSVKPNWWFAESYHLPFKHGRQWYCVVGPTAGGTSLQRIDTFYHFTILNWNHGNPIYGNDLTCTQTEVWSIPYMALPVNEDFNREFGVLISRFDRYLNKLIILIN